MDHEERLAALESKMKDVRTQLEANTNMIQEIRDNTQEIVDVFRASKGFIKVVNFVGVTVKWVAVTGAAVGAVWAYIHGHNVK